MMFTANTTNYAKCENLEDFEFPQRIQFSLCGKENTNIQYF
jgi:hypothetical protein